MSIPIAEGDPNLYYCLQTEINWGHLGRTIFIVEDNNAIRSLIKSLISRNSDNIYEFDDAEQAVSRYSELMPKIILMDIELKEKDGLWATRQILKINPRACIIIVSTHTSEAFRKAAKEAGTMGYIWKEELETLNTVVENLM